MAGKKGKSNGTDLPPDHEDAILWQHVVKSVTPLKTRIGKRRGITAAAAAENRKSKPSTGTGTRKKTPALPPPVHPPYRPAQSPAKETPGGFDAATATKLKKGRLEIEGRIDLHGMTQEEAFPALRRFILSAHKQGKRTLLVITGKGRLSTGGGVLKNMLPHWLSHPDLASAVLALAPAAAKDGGSGAFYVRLRKPRES